VPLTFDTSKPGLGAILKDYQELTLMYLWGLDGEEVGSREVWVHVNEALRPRTISRASIINFLDTMVEECVLDFTNEKGKGGYRRLYKVKYDEAGFKEHIAKVVTRSLLRDFPEETRKALKDLRY
jgi:hypothetical protein